MRKGWAIQIYNPKTTDLPRLRVVPCSWIPSTPFLMLRLDSIHSSEMARTESRTELAWMKIQEHRRTGNRGMSFVLRAFQMYFSALFRLSMQAATE